MGLSPSLCLPRHGWDGDYLLLALCLAPMPHPTACLPVLPSCGMCYLCAPAPPSHRIPCLPHTCPMPAGPLLQCALVPLLCFFLPCAFSLQPVSCLPTLQMPLLLPAPALPFPHPCALFDSLVYGVGYRPAFSLHAFPYLPHPSYLPTFLPSTSCCLLFLPCSLTSPFSCPMLPCTSPPAFPPFHLPHHALVDDSHKFEVVPGCNHACAPPVLVIPLAFTTCPYPTCLYSICTPHPSVPWEVALYPLPLFMPTMPSLPCPMPFMPDASALKFTTPCLPAMVCLPTISFTTLSCTFPGGGGGRGMPFLYPCRPSSHQPHPLCLPCALPSLPFPCPSLVSAGGSPCAFLPTRVPPTPTPLTGLPCPLPWVILPLVSLCLCLCIYAQLGRYTHLPVTWGLHLLLPSCGEEGTYFALPVPYLYHYYVHAYLGGGEGEWTVYLCCPHGVPPHCHICHMYMPCMICPSPPWEGRGTFPMPVGGDLHCREALYCACREDGGWGRTFCCACSPLPTWTVFWFPCSATPAYYLCFTPHTLIPSLPFPMPGSRFPRWTSAFTACWFLPFTLIAVPPVPACCTCIVLPDLPHFPTMPPHRPLRSFSSLHLLVPKTSGFGALYSAYLPTVSAHCLPYAFAVSFFPALPVPCVWVLPVCLPSLFPPLQACLPSFYPVLLLRSLLLALQPTYLWLPHLHLPIACLLLPPSWTHPATPFIPSPCLLIPVSLLACCSLVCCFSLQPAFRLCHSSACTTCLTTACLLPLSHPLPHYCRSHEHEHTCPVPYLGPFNIYIWFLPTLCRTPHSDRHLHTHPQCAIIHMVPDPSLSLGCSLQHVSLTFPHCLALSVPSPSFHYHHVTTYSLPPSLPSTIALLPFLDDHELDVPLPSHPTTGSWFCLFPIPAGSVWAFPTWNYMTTGTVLVHTLPTFQPSLPQVPADAPQPSPPRPSPYPALNNSSALPTPCPQCILPPAPIAFWWGLVPHTGVLPTPLPILLLPVSLWIAVAFTLLLPTCCHRPPNPVPSTLFTPSPALGWLDRLNNILLVPFVTFYLLYPIYLLPTVTDGDWDGIYCLVAPPLLQGCALPLPPLPACCYYHCILPTYLCSVGDMIFVRDVSCPPSFPHPVSLV